MNHTPTGWEGKGERTYCDTILFVTIIWDYLGFRILSNRVRLLYVQLSLINHAG
jgi:hypothetical protein